MPAFRFNWRHIYVLHCACVHAAMPRVSASDLFRFSPLPFALPRVDVLHPRVELVGRPSQFIVCLATLHSHKYTVRHTRTSTKNENTTKQKNMITIWILKACVALRPQVLFGSYILAVVHFLMSLSRRVIHSVTSLHRGALSTNVGAVVSVGSACTISSLSHSRRLFRPPPPAFGLAAVAAI